ncbi:MAG: 30S ribosomal protein S15 [Saprospiraceae bacterium]|nr:30S ribosomal protein S15 [Saprospiraceae bacterium]
MPTYLSKEKKAEFFAKFGGDAKNTGSTEGQIALLTYRIQSISAHLKTNRKDHSATRSLISMVGKRRSLLSYLAKKDVQLYRDLIVKIGIRDTLRLNK